MRVLVETGLNLDWLGIQRDVASLLMRSVPRLCLCELGNFFPRFLEDPLDSTFHHLQIIVRQQVCLGHLDMDADAHFSMEYSFALLRLSVLWRYRSGEAAAFIRCLHC